MRTLVPRLLAAGAVCVLLFLTGCASNSRNVDPLEKVNRFFYKVNDGLDHAVLKPASDFYVKVVPQPLRTGIGNALDNLGYVNVIVNDFLQGKVDQGLGDIGRMAVNSTVGVAGVFDPASGWGLPAHQNDFGVTLGKWGAGAGPYLVLPLLGPSSARDAPGILVARVTNPLYWINLPPSVSIPVDVAGLMDERSRLDAAIQLRDQLAIDPYIFMREAYLQHRLARIRQGPQPPADQSIYDEDLDSTTQPAAPISRANAAGE